MFEVVFRNFKPQDREAFRTLNEQWIEKYFQLEEKDRQSLGDPEGQILAKGGHILVAERDGQLVGCCALMAMPENDRLEVAKMTIAESERGQGVGRQLLEHVICFAKECYIRTLYLETNTKLESAVRLYEAVGFRHLPPEQAKPSPYARANVFMELQLHPFLASESALCEFVAEWEARTLPKAQWTHAAHVAVCAFYTAQLGHTEALRRMREGIPVYNLAVGGQNTADSGYHETLTCLWAQIIADFLATQQFATPFAAVESTVLRYGQERKLHETFYTFDVVADRLARREWVPPDKTPLPQDK